MITREEAKQFAGAHHRGKRIIRRALQLGVVLAASACAQARPASAASPCASPAPLLGRPDPRVTGYIVKLRNGTDVERAVERLAVRLGFHAHFVYRATGGFAADLTDAQLVRLRCEPEVQYVEHITVGTPG